MTRSNKVLDTEGVFVEIASTLETTLDRLQAPAWTGGHGWVCQPGALRLLRPGDPWPEGEILSAERVMDEAGDRSLHIRAAQGGWRFSNIQERQESGTKFLANSVRYLASFPELGRLHYRRYFCLVEQDGIQVYRPWAARFAGFSPKEES